MHFLHKKKYSKLKKTRLFFVIVCIVFTKCKRNIRDGFRLENLSWRLWYRQSVMHKKAEPKTSEDIVFPSPTPKQRLTRSHSMPDLSLQWSKSPVQNATGHKFFISEEKQQFDSIPVKKEASLPLPQQQKELTFTKKKPLRRTTNTASALSKPVSLLSDMLQRTESNVSLVKSTTSGGLKRCQSRYCRLDQFFMNAA
jgi:hypothetical protein